jgi:hypothetical protein
MEAFYDGERKNTLSAVNYHLVDCGDGKHHPVREIKKRFGIIILLLFQF